MSLLFCVSTHFLPGAWVTATDLPDILSNLTFNLLRNTRGRCRYTPQVVALSWGQDLDRDFPYASYHYDFVLAADVVYHHDCIEELLKTMRHFCPPGSQTTLLWANKIRFQSDLRFTECFKSHFNTTLLTELPQQEIRIYKAMAKEWQGGFRSGSFQWCQRLWKIFHAWFWSVLTFLDSAITIIKQKWSSWLKFQ